MRKSVRDFQGGLIPGLGIVLVFAVLLSLAGCEGGGEDEESGNRSPVAIAGGDQTVDAGSVVTLRGSGSDSDGAITSYRWEQTAGATVALSNADQALASFVAPQVDVSAVLMFRLIVTDNDGAASHDDVNVTIQPRTTAAMVSLSGTVSNYSDDAVVPGAVISVTQYDDGVSWDLGTTSTDDSGGYQIRVDAAPGQVHVRASADRFAPQSVVVELTEGMVSAVTDFAMVSVDVVREFQSTEQAEIRNQDYTLVRVPADGLVTESGSAPVGDVTAMVTVLDASRDPSAMPGGLVSVNAVTGALESIESFGAIDVTFMDETGEPLDLRPGQEAVVSIPLAEGKDLADALATMPLFYWSDDDGYWIRDGDASLEQVGSGQWAYTGRVSHFTTWIAALWYETIRIRGCVEDWEQNPVASAQVISTGLDYVGRSLAVTDSAGRFDIPAAGDSTVVLSAFGVAPGWWVGDVRMLHTDNDSMDLAQCLRIISVPPEDDEDDGDSDSSGVSQDMYDALLADYDQAVADRDAALAALAEAEAGRDTALAAQAEAEAAHAAAWEAQAAAEAGRDTALAALAVAEAELDKVKSVAQEALAGFEKALEELAQCKARCP